MNLWHDVSPGRDIPNIINVIIEIPENSKVKYELDKETGLLRVDRVLYSAMHYPLNYGFVPQTYCEDNDPLDVLVITQFPLLPGCVLDVAPIGVFEMIDGGEKDDKIIAVNINDPVVEHIKDIDGISPHKVKEIKHFFETYKFLQNNTHTLVENILNKKEALKIIQQSVEDYKKKFPKT